MTADDRRGQDETHQGVAELSLADALEMAKGLLRARIFGTAIEIYRRILSVVPDHPEALHYLGLALFQSGEPEAGIELVERVVKDDAGNLDARNNLGNMLVQRGQLAEAEAVFRQVLSLRPDHADAHANLATILARHDDIAGAEAELRLALQHNPDHGEACHNLGGLLRDTGRKLDGLSMFQRALVLRPYDDDSYLRVGGALESLGRIEEATAIYKRWVDLRPNNPRAQHMLASCTGQDVPARASDAYVTSTFDRFAGSFDQVLAKLMYRAPSLIADAVAETVGAGAASLDVLDAGAGTGWCGPVLRPFARRLTGVDLSAGMLAKAAERNLYDHLETAELVTYMLSQPAAYDLIVSADTLVYFGDLAEAMRASAGALRAGGHLIFTVEQTADDPAAGYRLNPHGRYSHSEPYVRRVLEEAALTPLAIKGAHLRVEASVPVNGLLVVARKTA